MSIVDTRTDHRLSLRKEKLDSLIFEKRLKSSNPDDWEEKQLAVVIKDLDIPPELNSLYERNDEQQKTLVKLLQDNDRNIVKFALKKLSNMSHNFRINEIGEIELEEEIFNMLLFYLFDDLDIKIKVKIIL